MKKIRSYTSIWSVEKVLYSINDFKLPFPITFTQMAWFVVSVFAVMLLGNLPPLSFIDGAFLKYFGVPFALTWSAIFLGNMLRILLYEISCSKVLR